MGNVNMEASQINYRGGEKKMSVEEALKSTSGEAAAIAQLQTDVLNLNSNKANQITIAPFFSAEASYEVGDLVYYNGLSYRCTNAHEGEWDADDFAATTIAGELDSLKSGLTNLSSAFHEVAVNESFYLGNQMGFVAWLGWSGKRIRGYMPMPNDAIYKGTYQAEITTGENLTVSVNGSVTNLDKTKISAITIYPTNGLVVIDFSEAPLNNVDNTIVSVITSFTVTRTA